MTQSNPPSDLLQEAFLLIMALFEDGIAPEGVNRLNELVCQRKEVRRLYVRCAHQRCAILPVTASAVFDSAEDPFDGTPLPAMDESGAADEKVAPATSPSIKMLDDNAGASDIAGRSHTRVSRPLKSLGQAAPDSTTRRIVRYPHVPFWPAMAAAVLVVASLAVFILRQGNRTSDGKSQRAVATVTATARATWENPAAATLPIATPLSLNAGYVELTFAGGARVVVEAPARFTLDSSTVLSLASGKLSATVHGGGFVVKTPTATITDLGTEFGVAVNSDGSTAVDVFQGRVRASRLSAGNAGEAATMLSEGQAARFSADGVQSDPAGASPQHFVRSLSADIAPLDVVDLVAGGDGTTHRRGLGIDVTTGRAGQLTQVAGQRGDHVYHRVAGLPVVDGCFIPDGSRGPMQIDSLGHAFTFPATTNQTFNLLWAGGAIPPAAERARNRRAASAVLDGVDYSTSGHGCLAMHASKGLTLDLDQIRRLHPRSSLSRFTCMVGNNWKLAPEDADRPPLPAKLYVIVDGLQCYTRTTEASGSRVEVPLDGSERFLTLVAVDGGSAIRANWILVGDPVIEFMAGGTRRSEIER